MPYSIEMRSGGEDHCVVKENEDGSEETVKCHPTHKEAEDHATALRIAESEEKSVRLVMSPTGDYYAVLDKGRIIKETTDSKEAIKIRATLLKNRFNKCHDEIPKIYRIASTPDEELHYVLCEEGDYEHIVSRFYYYEDASRFIEEKMELEVNSVRKEKSHDEYEKLRSQVRKGIERIRDRMH